MTEIPQWAKERACTLANEASGTPAWVPDDIGGFRVNGALDVLARYIAEHEEPPVDPLLIEARKLASELSKDAGSFDFISGRFDDWYAVRAVLAALRRGMELAREQSK